MLSEHLLQRFKNDVVLVEHRCLDGTTRKVAHWTHAHPPVRDANQEYRDSFTPLERMALMVTRRVGTPGFFLLIALWTVLWLSWNLIGPAGARFDPAPAFVLWLFISNLIQLLLMPLLLVGQNLLNRHAELRAETDFEVNQKAEAEVEAILLHLEHQAASIEHQEELSLRILRQLDAIAATSTGASAAAGPDKP